MSATEKLHDERHEMVMEGIKGIHDRLDELNGRTRKVEIEQSTMKWALGVLSSGFVTFVAWFFKG